MSLDPRVLASVAENMKAMLTKFVGEPPSKEAVEKLCDKLMPEKWGEEAKSIFKTAMRVSYCYDSAFTLESQLKASSDEVLEQVGEIGAPVPFLECEKMKRKGLVRDWRITREEDQPYGKDVIYELMPKNPVQFVKLDLKV